MSGGVGGLGVILLIVGVFLMDISGPAASPQTVYSPQLITGQFQQQFAPPVEAPLTVGPVAENFCPTRGTGAARSATLCSKGGKPLPPSRSECIRSPRGGLSALANATLDLRGLSSFRVVSLGVFPSPAEQDYGQDNGNNYPCRNAPSN